MGKLERIDDGHLYSIFVEQLIRLGASESWTKKNKDQVRHLIGNGSIDALDELLSQDHRSENGIFFTNLEVKKKFLTKELREKFRRGVSIFDPSCGAGDLLLMAAAHLPISSNLSRTISEWAPLIGGCDINPAFVHAARIRLVLLAIYRHGFPKVSKDQISDLADQFTGIVCLDYLKASIGGDYDVLLANPPFVHAFVHENWAKGRTQLAAVFMMRVVERAKLGQQIVAVLPDVLRSGSRYVSWREIITKYGSALKAEVYGCFSEKIDVDVFFLRITRGEQSKNKADWSLPRPTRHGVLADICRVKVGPVVPHRHPDAGMKYLYATADNCKISGEYALVTQTRGFDGTKFDAPFVLLRRTSSPSDTKRIVAHIVRNGKNIAIENHLLVLSPKDLSLASCRKLLAHLRSDKVHDWLNHAIRCRHLTTRIIKQIPISEELP